MDYATAAAGAPPGWRHFSLQDFSRLPPSVIRHEMSRVPAGESRLLEDGDTAAQERFLRAEFWTLVYHLEPERWDELAQAEPVTPELIDALPRTERALDVGAGSGRLTQHLVQRSRHVTAIEPSLGLLGMLQARLPSVDAISGWAEALPVRDGWAQLTAACGALGPDERMLSELERVTCQGGFVALINPEEPEWFEAHGWRRREVKPARIKPHDGRIEEFFGPLDPPRVLVTKRV